MRLWLTVSVLLFVFAGAQAQQTLRGRIIENKTQVALGNINIKNLNSGQSAISDSKGAYSINARINELVLFTGFGYIADTVLVTDLKYREVFLEPVGHQLNEVQINAFGKVNKQATAIPYDKDYHGQTMQYQPDEKYEGYYKGGIIVRVWSSKREERDRKKLTDIAYTDEVGKEIQKVFSDSNIALYIPLKGKELQTFVLLYTPNIKTFKDPSFNLLTYLNKNYKEFMRLPAEKRQTGTIFN